jgi:hypothetical protein
MSRTQVALLGWLGVLLVGAAAFVLSLRPIVIAGHSTGIPTVPCAAGQSPEKSPFCLVTPDPNVSKMPDTNIPPSSDPMPSGGISEEEARSIAQKAAPLSAVYVSAEAGPFGTVVSDPTVSEGLTIAADHEVWVVRFTAVAAPCAPGTSELVCDSPRPGTVTVVLDYFSGKLYITAGNYPNPNP